MTAIRRLAPLLFLLVSCRAAGAQPTAASAWDGWQFLQGKWVGEGASEPGEGSGYFSFARDLQNKAWVRRNHSEYPATKDRAKFVHEDLMVVYFDEGAGKTRAFYYDTEAHVINYTADFSSDGNRLTFLSDALAGAPRYRLIYLRGNPGHMTVTLEVAQPEKPDEFQKIVEGRVRKLASR